MIQIKLRDLVGFGFDFLFTTDAHYIINPASKDSKKSNTYNGFLPILHVLINTKHNVVIAKNELKMHKASTINDFKFALKKFSAITKFD